MGNTMPKPDSLFPRAYGEFIFPVRPGSKTTLTLWLAFHLEALFRRRCSWWRVAEEEKRCGAHLIHNWVSQRQRQAQEG